MKWELNDRLPKWDLFFDQKFLHGLMINKTEQTWVLVLHSKQNLFHITDFAAIEHIESCCLVSWTDFTEQRLYVFSDVFSISRKVLIISLVFPQSCDFHSITSSSGFPQFLILSHLVKFFQDYILPFSSSFNRMMIAITHFLW